MRKDTKIHNQPLNGMNFDFVQFKEKVLLSLCETAAVAKIASVEWLRKPQSTRLSLLWFRCKETIFYHIVVQLVENKLFKEL